MKDSSKRPIYRPRGLPLALGLSAIAWLLLIWLLPWRALVALLVLLLAGCVTLALSPALRTHLRRSEYLLAGRSDRAR